MFYSQNKNKSYLFLGEFIGQFFFQLQNRRTHHIIARLKKFSNDFWSLIFSLQKLLFILLLRLYSGPEIKQNYLLEYSMRCFNLMRRNHYCRCWCQATRGPAELTNLLIDMGQMNKEIGKIIKFLFSLTGIFKDFSLNGGVLYHSVHIIIFQMEY